MNKTLVSVKKMESSYGGIALLTMAALFVFGAIIGSVAASGILASGEGQLYNRLTDYIFRFTGDYMRPSLFDALVVNFRYHVLVFLVSFTGLGVLLIPAFVTIRGFFLSLAVTAFVRTFGINGAFLSLAVFGLQNILSLPALMVLSHHAYYFARTRNDIMSQAGRRVSGGMSSDRYFSLCGVIFAVLFLCTLIEMFLSPLFINYIRNFL